MAKMFNLFKKKTKKTHKEKKIFFLVYMNTDGWQAYTDTSGITYYFNSKTGISQWEKPLALQQVEVEGYDPNPVYNREYLRNFKSLQKKRNRQKYIQNVLNTSQQHILQCAYSDKTSYCWENDKYIAYLIKNTMPFEVVTDEELIEAFQKKYPDCKVSHGELWIEQGPGIHIVKTGIVINWS